MPQAQEEIIGKLSDEVIAKIRRISINTAKIVQETFAGQYQSVFKGRGMEFDSVREYQPGDEIRSIDWNVTARTGRLQVKKFVEERELSVMLLLDASSSAGFGSRDKLKSELAAEICSVIAFSAIYNKDNVGLFIFTDNVEKALPPRKGTNHVLRVIREALVFKPKGTATDISEALAYLNKVMHRRAVCFIISDFLTEGYQESLSIANRRHDIIAIRIIDPREMELPNVGVVVLDDAETKEQAVADTSSAAFRDKYRDQSLNRLRTQEEFFASSGIDNIDIYTDTPYVDSLVKFFRMREKRLSRGF
ncbi:MAG: DUF58 domain-containing protein [Candidatus Omnitrophica bacterium]|nr:DUF58 domain-containing protein [Candidatus Omnitrophota bacterium]